VLYIVFPILCPFIASKIQNFLGPIPGKRNLKKCNFKSILNNQTGKESGKIMSG
jgi:hypothetical protein